MKSKKLLTWLLAGTLLTGATALSGCDLFGSATSGGMQTYVMEAEYTNLDNVAGAGISSDQHGVEMIYGDGTQAQKDLGWSNGYFVGYTYATGVTLTFDFNAETAETATIILRLGSELGTLSLDPTVFEVRLNDAAIPYSTLSVTGSSIEEMRFEDKTVTTTATLKAGANKIEIVILKNTLMNGTKTGGPCVDCIKVETKAKLTWTDKTDNPSRRGAIE